MEEIAVIGGGLAGAALAWALAERQHPALLIERSTIGGGGATAHSRGIVRAYDPEPRLVVLGLEGVRVWAELEAERPGLFRRPGVLYFPAPGSRDRVRAFIADHREVSYPVELIDGAAAADVCPVLHEDLACADRPALWEPAGGYVDPRAGARLLADTAQALGGTVLEGCAIEAIAPRADGVELRTSAGRLTVRRAIVAAGAAALELLPDRATLFCRSIPLTSFADEPSATPQVCLIDEVSRCYLRPGGPELYFGGGARQVDAPVPGQLTVDPAAANQENLVLSRRVLATSGNAVLAAHIGHDAYTPDFLPISVLPDAGGVGLLAGFSGRGAKYIPALARRYAAALTGRPR